jgi:hypothetical protein
VLCGRGLTPRPLASYALVVEGVNTLSKSHAENLWPKRRLNLVVGASGAGKSRFILPQLFALQEGKPIMGRATEPTRIAYVACDRTAEDASDTMADLGLDPSKMPIYSFMDDEIEWSFTNVLKFIPEGTQLTFIEAIGALVAHGKINDYHEVLRFGRAVHRARRLSGSDFWGSTHVPKLKKDEDFKHTRENVLGSAAWAGISGTIVLIDELPTEQRAVHIMTRDLAPEKLICEFQDGHLVESSQLVGRSLMDRWLNGIAAEMVVTFELMQAIGERYKLSRATVTRWIKEAESDGRLVRVDRGTYRKRPSQ